MKKTHIGMMGAMVVTAGLPSLAMANECSTVRFAEVGWTDITATTALASEVLEGMGYEARVDTVSVPIAYSGMENGDFDVFLGNWMPSMASISDPYVEKGTVDRLTANLEGAKYTLAVPQYVYDAGVTSVEDLAEHADQFDQQPELSVPQGPMLPAVGLQAALDAPHRAVVREGFGIQVVHGELELAVVVLGSLEPLLQLLILVEQSVVAALRRHASSKK